MASLPTSQLTWGHPASCRGRMEDSVPEDSQRQGKWISVKLSHNPPFVCQSEEGLVSLLNTWSVWTLS